MPTPDRRIPWKCSSLALALVTGTLLQAGCAPHERLYAPIKLPLGDLPDPFTLIVGTAILIDLGATEVSQWAHDQQPPQRQPSTLRGRLVDSRGNAISNATIQVRQTARFTPTPETLPVQTIATGTDGAFAVPIDTNNAICLDFSAPGCRPLRRWFVVLSQGVAKTLPAP